MFCSLLFACPILARPVLKAANCHTCRLGLAGNTCEVCKNRQCLHSGNCIPKSECLKLGNEYEAVGKCTFKS